MDIAFAPKDDFRFKEKNEKLSFNQRKSQSFQKQPWKFNAQRIIVKKRIKLDLDETQPWKYEARYDILEQDLKIRAPKLFRDAVSQPEPVKWNQVS